MKTYNNLFDKIISLKNLFCAWDTFKKDKRHKADVQFFEWELEKYIFELHRDLKYLRYKHGKYSSFYINDPKQRHIHKATVRDRVLHHAIFEVLNPIFEPTFIAHSFSCRVNKGTHKGVTALNDILRIVSSNYTQPCFALKCDIKKFFASVDHSILLDILNKRICDKNVMWLLKEVVESFPAIETEGKGIPIGNLTSQLFANVYLNKFDQIIKHKLRVKHYIRYTDDFVIVSRDKSYLEVLLPPISDFLFKELRLSLHPRKVAIRKPTQGVDFLGYVLRPHHTLLRTKTKQRIFRKLRKNIIEYKRNNIDAVTLEQSFQSYLGVLSHADTNKIKTELENHCWFWLND